MWDVFRNNVRFGLAVQAAATSTVMSLESSGVSHTKLPDTLVSTRDMHASTREWMSWEWEHSCELAHTGLVATITGVVVDAKANPERFGWVVAAVTQTTSELAAHLAAGYHWEFVTGHAGRYDGVRLVACPSVICESLKILDGVPGPGVKPLEGIPNDIGLALHADPGIVMIAETLKRDTFTLSWPAALDRACVVANIAR